MSIAGRSVFAELAILFLVLTAQPAQLAAQQQVLYGLSSAGRLFTIDPDRGVGDLGTEARNRLNNSYGNYWSLVSKGGYFYTGAGITGPGKIIKFNLDPSSDTLFSTIQYFNPRALALNAINGKVYLSLSLTQNGCTPSGGSGNHACYVGELDMGTGQVIASSLVYSGLPSIINAMTGLAFDSSGLLYFFDGAGPAPYIGNEIGRIDLGSGAITPLCGGFPCWTSGSGHRGLAINPTTQAMYSVSDVVEGAHTYSHLLRVTLLTNPYSISYADLGRITSLGADDNSAAINGLTFGPAMADSASCDDYRITDKLNVCM